MSYLDSVVSVAQSIRMRAGENKELAIAAIVIEKAATIAKIIASTNTAVAGFTAQLALGNLAAAPAIPAAKISGAIGIASTIASAIQAIQQIRQAGNAEKQQNDLNAKMSLTAPAAKYAQGGLLRGPSHAFGGILTQYGELEGGEYVINRRSTQAFMPILEQLNRIGNEMSSPQNLLSTKQAQPIIVKSYVVSSEMTSRQERLS